jgi:hypothetical protein
MLTREDDVDAHALRRQGWTISAIARHLGHDRKTIRAYLTGGRVAGVRVSTAEDPLGPYVGYLRQRLTDDPHVWATVLFDEVVALGYERAYATFTRQVRDRQVRPHCEPCSSSNHRAHVDIDPTREFQRAASTRVSRKCSSGIGCPGVPESGVILAKARLLRVGLSAIRCLSECQHGVVFVGAESDDRVGGRVDEGGDGVGGGVPDA